MLNKFACIEEGFSQRILYLPWALQYNSRNISCTKTFRHLFVFSHQNWNNLCYNNISSESENSLLVPHFQFEKTNRRQILFNFSFKHLLLCIHSTCKHIQIDFRLEIGFLSLLFKNIPDWIGISKAFVEQWRIFNRIETHLEWYFLLNLYF